MLRIVLRFTCYAVVVAALTVLLMLMGVSSPHGFGFDRYVPSLGQVTSELSPVEITQNLLLALCAFMYATVAWLDRLRQPMAVTLAALMLAFLLRELGFFLDVYVADNLWQVLCAVLIAFTLVHGIQNRSRWQQGWRRSWPSAGLAIMLTGVIMLLTFAQLLGSEIIWRSILADTYVRVIKIAVEELFELGAYMLIAIGTAEFFFVWSRLPRSTRRRQSHHSGDIA